MGFALVSKIGLIVDLRFCSTYGGLLVPQYESS